jgi:uncharacterized coiled-coil protein SlyX
MTRSDLPADGGYIVLPRKMSWAVGVLFLVQAAGGLLFVSKLEGRISNLEVTVAERRTLNEARFASLASDRDRLIRVEEQMRYIVEALRRIERQLEGSRGSP